MEHEMKLCHQQGVKHFTLRWLQSKVDGLLLEWVAGLQPQKVQGNLSSPLLPWVITLRGHTRAGSDCSNDEKHPCETNRHYYYGDKVIKIQDKMLVCFLCFPNLPCLTGLGFMLISSKEAPGLFGHWKCNNYDKKPWHPRVTQLLVDISL